MVRRRTANPTKTDVSGVEMRSSNINKEPKTHLLILILKWMAIVAISLYLLIPIIICTAPIILEQVLFLNMQYSKNEPQSLMHPTFHYKLKETASFKIDCDGNELGMWHVLPLEKVSVYPEDNYVSLENVGRELNKANIIIIYHHGAGMSRATGDNKQRAEVYKLFQSEGYHTIAFDYRGYGDSSGWPSEAGVVNDSVCVFNWVKSRARPEAKVYLWGHSMGASVATLATKKISDQCGLDESVACSNTDGLILEGGFTSVRAATGDNFLVQCLMHMYSKFLISKVIDIALTASQTSMETGINLQMIDCSVLLLHAEDDNIIPCKHGEDLFDICKNSKRNKATFVKFRANHGYCHVDIYKAPELPKLIKDFMNTDEKRFQNFVI